MSGYSNMALSHGGVNASTGGLSWGGDTRAPGVHHACTALHLACVNTNLGKAARAPEVAPPTSPFCLPKIKITHMNCGMLIWRSL